MDGAAKCCWRILKFERNTPPNILEIETDRNRLQQVLLNLFSNAKDAIGRNGWIEVETGVRNGDVYICVADSGRGMSPEELDKIFSPLLYDQRSGQRNWAWAFGQLQYS